MRKKIIVASLLGGLFLLSVPKASAQATYGSKNESIVFTTQNRLKTYFRIKATGCWWDINGNGQYDPGEEIKGNGKMEGKYVTENTPTHIYAEKFESFDTLLSNDDYSELTNEDLEYLQTSGAPSLTSLRVSRTSIRELDLSANVNLERFIGTGTNLTSIILGNKPKLQTIECQWNTNLTSIDLSGCTALTWLDMTGSGLNSINFGNISNLRTLHLGINELKSITLPTGSLNSLKEIDLERNSKLQLIHLPAMPNLEYLYLKDCGLRNVNVTQLPKLKILDVSKNALTALNVSSNQELFRLFINQNQIKKDEMQKLVEGINGRADIPNLQTDPTYDNKYLYAVDLTTSSPAEGNQMTKKQVAILKGKFWLVRDLHSAAGENSDLPYNGEEDTDLLQRVILTTSRTKGESISLTAVGDGLWIDLNANNIKEDNETIISGQNATFTLTKGSKLTLYAQTLTSLVAKNDNWQTVTLKNTKHIDMLNLANNDLSDLFLGEAPNLRELNVSNNKLYRIGLSSNWKLSKVDLSNNVIEMFDPTQAFHLTSINLRNNHLNSLKVSDLSKLSFLDISLNQFSQKSLIKMITGLNNAEGDKLLMAIDKDPKEKNHFSKIMKEIATRRHWTVKAWENGNQVDFEGEENEKIGEYSESIKLFTSVPVGQNMPASIYVKGRNVWVDVDNDGFQTDQDIILVDDNDKITPFTIRNKAFTIYGSHITDFRGVGLELDSADASQLKNVQILFLDKNNMTKIVMPKSEQLKELGLTENKFSGEIDLFPYKNLEKVNLSFNSFDQIILGTKNKMVEFFAGSNQLQTIDLNGLPNLKELILSQNKFKSLDISQQQKLGRLSLFGNQINQDEMQKVINQLSPVSVGAYEFPQKDFFVVDKSSNGNEQNRISHAQVLQAKAKNWICRQWQDQGPYPDYKGDDYNPAANPTIAGNPIKITVQNNRLHIENLSGNETISIYQISGKLVYRQIIKGQSAKVDLPKGIYLVNIGKQSMKVIVP